MPHRRNDISGADIGGVSAGYCGWRNVVPAMIENVDGPGVRKPVCPAVRGVLYGAGIVFPALNQNSFLPGLAPRGGGMVLPLMSLAVARKSRKPRLQAYRKKLMPINPAMILVFRLPIRSVCVALSMSFR
ncbi:MAG TPA: hypothetical protein VK567_20885 [Bradyrhizobium sp.]|jgi:hypothetical protein|nr:hypothetical protein [Bradyrhizobium sp.]